MAEVPMTLEPSKKVTFPAGDPLAAATWAVNVTRCPTIAGFEDDVTVVVVLTAAALTISTTRPVPAVQ
jgi:hypothetical protein